MINDISLAKNLLNDSIENFIGYVIKMVESNPVVLLPNGSRIIVSGFANVGDRVFGKNGKIVGRVSDNFMRVRIP